MDEVTLDNIIMIHELFNIVQVRLMSLDIGTSFGFLGKYGKFRNSS